MADPTPSQIRDWARAQGLEISDRGPIPPHIRDAWEAWNHPDDDTAAPPPPGDPDVSRETSSAEQPPRNVRAAGRAPRLGFGRRGQKGSKGKSRTRRRTHARVPVDDVISSVWRGLAGMARPIPATSKLLKIQAPVAGMILEDTVKDTAVDGMLQPLARMTQGSEAVAVLLGPPLIVTMMELNPESRPFLIEPLRELMLRWCKIAGPKMKEALAREQEFEDQYGETVDDLIAGLFDPPPGATGPDDAPPNTIPGQVLNPWAAAAAEDQAVRDAQERLMNDHPG